MNTTEHDEAEMPWRRLVGAEAIRLSRPPECPQMSTFTTHARHAGRSKTAGEGGSLIASKRQLIRHAEDHAAPRSPEFRAAAGFRDRRFLGKRQRRAQEPRQGLWWNALILAPAPRRQQASSLVGATREGWLHRTPPMGSSGSELDWSIALFERVRGGMTI
jgi:hypothetical protein